MIKKLLAAIILTAILCSVTCARMPQVGDQVIINSGPSVISEGTITDIGNGLICLHQIGTYGESDMCIGIGSISTLTWID
jgi:hypothetical protein